MASQSQSKMQVELNDGNISIMSNFQRLTYRCLSMFGPGMPQKSVEDKRRLIEVWCGKLFRDELEYNIVFNESIWLPTEPESYGNILELWVNTTRLYTTKHIRIDFRQELSDCPLFNIEYVTE